MHFAFAVTTGTGMTSDSMIFQVLSHGLFIGCFRGGEVTFGPFLEVTGTDAKFVESGSEKGPELLEFMRLANSGRTSFANVAGVSLGSSYCCGTRNRKLFCCAGAAAVWTECGFQFFESGLIFVLPRSGTVGKMRKETRKKYGLQFVYGFHSEK